MQPTYFSYLLKKPTWAIFLCTWLFYFIGLFLFSQFVWDENTYMIDFKGANFEKYLSGMRRIDVVRYALSPVWVIGISAIIWTLIKTGLVIKQIEFNGSLLLKIIFIGLFFLSLPFWIKSVWLILIKGNYTPNDIRYFFPGSIIPFLDISGMNEIMVKALAHINLYHIGLILFISWQLSVNSSMNYFKSFLLVFSTYGSGLALLQCLIIVIAL